MMESWAGVRPRWVGGPRVPKRGGSRVRISELVPGVGRDSPGIETSLGVSASGAPLPPHGQKPRDEWDSGTRPARTPGDLLYPATPRTVGELTTQPFVPESSDHMLGRK
jgi:hypothetical protein